MLKVYINGNQIPLELPIGLPEIFNVVQHSDLIMKKSWVIRDVIIDGELLSDDQLKRKGSDFDLSGKSKIEFVLESQVQILANAINDGKIAGMLLSKKLIDIASELKTGATSTALHNLADVIDQMKYYFEYLKYLFNNGQEKFHSSLVNWPGQGDHILKILSQIINSQENADWVLLSDLLEYELAPQIEQISCILDLAMQRVENTMYS